jgi:hypothetical protein
MRADWKDLLGDDVVVQANLSVTYPGIVRAWHRHLRGQTDYFLVVRGSKIFNSSVEYCVILENASIIGVERLEESLIGRNAKVVKGEGNRRFVKLNVGDYSEVLL